MKERPILFNAPMVRAILNRSKTQTLRIVKPQPPMGCRYEINGNHNKACCIFDAPDLPGGIGFCPPRGKSDHLVPCPYGAPGDRLWVRETWATSLQPENHEHAKDGYTYRADWTQEDDSLRDFLWRPSIFMPRAASRITLEIETVRVERLNDIREDGAIAEGVGYAAYITPLKSFKTLWNTINGPGSWDANPFVWVIEFKREKS